MTFDDTELLDKDKITAITQEEGDVRKRSQNVIGREGRIIGGSVRTKAREMRISFVTDLFSFSFETTLCKR
jgi:hypothetical protein